MVYKSIHLKLTKERHMSNKTTIYQREERTRKTMASGKKTRYSLIYSTNTTTMVSVIALLRNSLLSSSWGRGRGVMGGGGFYSWLYSVQTSRLTLANHETYRHKSLLKPNTAKM